MKTIILGFILLASSLFVDTTFAKDCWTYSVPDGQPCSVSESLWTSPTSTPAPWSAQSNLSSLSSNSANNTASTTTTIYTSEMVPWAVCTCVAPWATLWEGQAWPTLWEAACGDITTRKYKCTVSTGLSWFESIIAAIVRTVVYVVMLLGVLAIVGLGIAWAWAGGEDVKMKSNLKHWGINVLVGLTILFLFRYILTFLAPWIFN